MLWKVRTTLVLPLLLALAPATSAQTYGPITFEEIELPVGTVIDNLAIDTLDGAPIPTLTFGFSVSGVPSAAAVVFTSAGTGAYYAEPLISGPASGELTIDFGADVKKVSFGFGFNALGPPAGSCTLAAYAANGSPVASITRSTSEVTPFQNGELRLSGVGPFRRVIVSFSTQVSLFGFDNLLYELQPPPIPALPGPGLGALAVLFALLAILALRRTAN